MVAVTHRLLRVELDASSGRSNIDPAGSGRIIKSGIVAVRQGLGPLRLVERRAATVAPSSMPVRDMTVVTSPSPLASSPPDQPRSTSLGHRPVADEPSAYGKFVLTVQGKDADSCHVSLRLSSGREVSLFVAPGCSGDVPGMDLIGADAKIGSVRLPFVAPTGDEFHVFDIASARGGNASDAVDYWVTVVRSTEAWSTSIEAAMLAVASRSDGAPATLVLEEPASTTDAGQRYTVSFRSATRTLLPKLPSTIRSRETRNLFGDLSGGFHASDWRPAVAGEGKVTAIDDKGRCALPEVGQQYGDVAMQVEVTTWSDGRTRVKCLSVERLNLVP